MAVQARRWDQGGEVGTELQRGAGQHRAAIMLRLGQVVGFAMPSNRARSPLDRVLQG